MVTEQLRSVLQQHPLGLVFDIDGTLSPIAPTPDQARLYPGVSELLQKARQFASVAIMTGRAVVDGARMVNVGGLTYIGTHGLEWSEGLPTADSIQLFPTAREYIEPGKYLLDLVEKQLVPDLPGLLVQRKTIGGSVHYRLTENHELARKRILGMLEEPAQRVHMRLGEGKAVVEILAPLTINKGIALRQFVERFGLRGIVFAGDDRTDLYAVQEISVLRQEGCAAYSVVVQHRDTMEELLKQADGVVQEVEGMVELLQAMVAFLSNTTQIS